MHSTHDAYAYIHRGASTGTPCGDAYEMHGTHSLYSENGGLTESPASVIGTAYAHNGSSASTPYGDAYGDARQALPHIVRTTVPIVECQ